MSCKHFFLCWLSLFLLLFFGEAIWGQSTNPVTELYAEVINDKAGNPEVHFNLGSLVSGSTTAFSLEIYNPTDRQFSLAKIRKTCSCTEIKADRKVLESEDRLILFLSLEAPSRADSTEVRSMLFLESEPGEGLTVRLSYSFDGLLVFGTKAVSAEYGAEDRNKSFLVPLLITAPVKLSDVILSTGPELHGLIMDTESTDGKHFVVCKLNDDLFSKGGHGEIVVEYPALGRRDRIPCTIERRPPLKVMPSVLRFGEESDGVATANLLIRVDSSYTHWSAGKDTGVEAEAVFSIDKATVGYTIDAKRIAPCLYRATIKRSVKRREVNDSKPISEIRILANVGDHELSVGSKVFDNER